MTTVSDDDEFREASDIGCLSLGNVPALEGVTALIVDLLISCELRSSATSSRLPSVSSWVDGFGVNGGDVPWENLLDEGVKGE